MNSKNKKLWDDCLHLIKENVTEQQFNSWFKPIVFESYNIDTRTVLIRVSSMFVYEYIEENFLKLLSKVLTRVFVEGVQLSYKVVTDREHNLTQNLQADEVSPIEPKRQTARANQSPTILETAKQDELDSQLDPHKSFSNYIEGDSNKLPRSIGMSIAEHPNTTQFNPMWQDTPCQCYRYSYKAVVSHKKSIVC